jgi:hypothetical protein
VPHGKRAVCGSGFSPLLAMTGSGNVKLYALCYNFGDILRAGLREFAPLWLNFFVSSQDVRVFFF